MLKRVVKTSELEISTFSVPVSLMENDSELRKNLYYFAQSCESDRHLCFWVNQAGGSLRAYFRTNRGMESRTYSPKEVTDAIFNSNLLFFQSPEEILNLLEESPQSECKELAKHNFEFACA
jgi:hypothetical protein